MWQILYVIVPTTNFFFQNINERIHPAKRSSAFKKKHMRNTGLMQCVVVTSPTILTYWKCPNIYVYILQQKKLKT